MTRAAAGGPRATGRGRRAVVDLNADVGEGPWRRQDDALVHLVTSVHVACGYHAGDPGTMRRAVRAAAAAGTVVGAHPSYPDRAGFGRVAMDRSPAQVAGDVRAQIEVLDGIAGELGTAVRSVKPHGALYHRMASDRDCALAIAGAVASSGKRLVLVVPAGSAACSAVRDSGVPVVPEAFGDRRYLPDGTLAPRTVPGSVITDPDEAAAQAVSLVTAGEAVASDGTVVQLRCATLCIHGDTPGALRIVEAVRDALEAAGVVVAPFASDTPASDTAADDSVADGPPADGPPAGGPPVDGLATGPTRPSRR